MSKKLALVFTAVIFFSGAGSVSAEVVFNEIELSPIENRFIELYNDGSSAVDLTDWYIQRKTQTGSEFTSLVSKTNFAGKTIGPGSYFVISRTAMSNSNLVLGSLTLTESNTIQIKNQSGEIVDIICWGEGCSKTANPTDGKSIQRIGNSWVVSDPTPGGANSSSGSSGNDDQNNGDDSNDNDDSSSSSGSSASAKSTSSAATTSSKIKTEVTVRDIAYVGIPLAFQGKVMQGSQQLYKGLYFWNFGDGDFREVKVINSDKFTHTYFYPGDYKVVFEYYKDSFADTPSASEEFNIKVIDPVVSIARVGDVNDFYVELWNNTDYEVDVSGWLIVGRTKSFTIPKNTIIAGQKRIIISGRTSGLALADLAGLRLDTPAGETVFEYFTYTPAVRTKKSTSRTPTDKEENIYGESAADNTSLSPEELGVALAYAGTGENARARSALLWPVVFAVFISVAAGAVYFIRRSKSTPTPGEDFELLDE